MWKKITEMVFGKGKDEAGNQVERLESISMTLSAGDPDAPRMARTEPAYSPALKAKLDAACQRLPAVNASAAERWGLGTEENFSFDQSEGNLDLVFSSGKTLTFPAQFIGSFDPRDGSFLWAWGNPSLAQNLTRLAQSLKASGEASGDTLLTTRKMGLAFEDIERLVAIAASEGGTPLVYRLIVNDSVSLFVALTEPALALNDAPTNAGRSEAEALVRAFDADCLVADTVYRQTKDESFDALDRCIEQKMIPYRRDWHRDDTYWEPSSAGWPSDHDWAADRHSFTIGHPDGGLLVVRINAYGTAQTRLVRRIEGQLKIVDELIGWGSGFVWPTPSP